MKNISNKIKEASAKGKDLDFPKIITVSTDKLYVKPYIEAGLIDN